MTLLQLLLFTWVAAWVFAESLSPGISYIGKLQASIIATFAAGYANDAHRARWRKLKSWMR
ncbi:hypothetical protein [Candidatus Berkiella aquae]|uniref:Uncharacterized protein n=1 Tax=Candidatus Berkiella aquae TaxID=295108 RepID=A0A0Q9YNS7_9GAMM|nr:hypothetical protein [Candidatus Berkiella aquae]MCS5712371.1 hypothetical protein [Candidatus Berkiella aquae]